MQKIHEIAMLASVTISCWTARKHDKAASHLVAFENEATDQAGRYNKVLISKTALKAINQTVNKTRSTHYEQTLPWTDDGWRILTAANYFNYMREMASLKRAFEGRVIDFLDNYNQAKEEARLDLGKLFNEDDYPSEKALRKKFEIDIKINPLPKGNDFRVDLNEAQVASIQTKIEERLKEGQRIAMQDIWLRIHKAVTAMRDRLENYRYDPEAGKMIGYFRDTLVTNIIDIVDLMPRLNIASDPKLDEMCARLKNDLCNDTAQSLREDSQLRETTKQKAEDILNSMAAYIGEANNE